MTYSLQPSAYSLPRPKTFPQKPVIGLLGGVGAGKSTVAAVLADLGCVVIPGDDIGHELLGAAVVRREIRRQWGGRVFAADGSVDRSALGKIVFGHPAQLRALDRILQPRIRRRIQRRIALARKDPAVPAIVVDAAILLEARWDDLCTDLVFVRSAATQRARRVSRSRRWDRGTWARREKSQFSLDKKRRRCDYIIGNSSSLSCLRERVRELFRKIVQDADLPR